MSVKEKFRQSKYLVEMVIYYSELKKSLRDTVSIANYESVGSHSSNSECSIVERNAIKIIEIEGLIDGIISRFLEAHTHIINSFEKLAPKEQYIIKEYCDNERKIEDLAEELDCNAEYLSKKIRRILERI